VSDFTKVIIFGSVRFLLKKSNQTEFFFKKKPKSVQTDQFRFGFLGQKRSKPVWLGFFGSVWFGFFGFRLIKPKPNRTGRFF
jgi:hypothetical protein